MCMPFSHAFFFFLQNTVFLCFVQCACSIGNIVYYLPVVLHAVAMTIFFSVFAMVKKKTMASYGESVTVSTTTFRLWQIVQFFLPW